VLGVQKNWHFLSLLSLVRSLDRRETAGLDSQTTCEIKPIQQLEPSMKNRATIMVMQFARVVVVDDDGYNQQVDDGCGRRLLDHWDRETSES